MSKLRCSICANPDALAINAQLQAGLSQKSVAANFPGTSRFAISRHFRNCLSVASAIVDGNLDSREEVRKWLSRADDQYLLAQASGDQRSAIAALAGGLRATEAKVRAEQRDSEVSAQVNDNEPVPIQFLDKYIQQLCAALARIEHADVDVLRIAVGMLDDADLLGSAEMLAQQGRNRELIPQE